MGEGGDGKEGAQGREACRRRARPPSRGLQAAAGWVLVLRSERWRRRFQSMRRRLLFVRRPGQSLRRRRSDVGRAGSGRGSGARGTGREGGFGRGEACGVAPRRGSAEDGRRVAGARRRGETLVAFPGKGTSCGERAGHGERGGTRSGVKIIQPASFHFAVAWCVNT